MFFGGFPRLIGEIRHDLPYPEGMKVLVCEREPAMAHHIRRELERWGHEVVEAYDEVEALRRVRTEWFERVYLDDTAIGLAPLRALRAAPWSADVPCVVLTACPRDATVFTAYEAGADMVLTKPFNPQELQTFRRT